MNARRCVMLGLTALSIWIGVAAAFLLLDERTIGRYANTFSGEYGVHCWKMYDVTQGEEVVRACIDGTLPDVERNKVFRRTVETYFGELSKLIALSAPLPLIVFFSGMTLIRMRRSTAAEPEPTN